MYQIIEIICAEKNIRRKRKVARHELIVFKCIFWKSEDIASATY